MRILLAVSLVGAYTTATLAAGAEGLRGLDPDYFVVSSQSPIVNHSSTQAILGDIDGDGDLDAAVSSSTFPGVGIRLLVNDGNGHFAEVQSLGSIHCDIVFGDMDGDLDLDLLISQPALTVYFNDGDGVFTPGLQAIAGTYRGPRLADLDGDLDLDVVSGEFGVGNVMFLNDGTGTLTSNGMAWPGVEGQIALGDLNGDGNVDAYVGRGGGSNLADEVYFGNGQAQFVDSGQSLGNFPTSAIALGDLDDDGDLDVVVGEWLGGRNHVWRNDGTGSMTLGPQRPGMEAYTGDVRLDDIDQDGDLDLLILNSSEPMGAPPGPAQNEVWLNDGSGLFELVQLMSPAHSREGAVGDLDGDGCSDLIVANHQSFPVGIRVWFGQQCPFFTDGFESGDLSGWTTAVSSP